MSDAKFDTPSRSTRIERLLVMDETEAGELIDRLDGLHSIASALSFPGIADPEAVIKAVRDYCEWHKRMATAVLNGDAGIEMEHALSRLRAAMEGGE